MSLVISSTTDSQEAVNTAAGLPNEAVVSTPEPQASPTTPETPPAEPETEPAEEPDEQDDEQKEPVETQPKKKGGFQRKIERLEFEKEQYRRALELAQQQQRPAEPQAPQRDPNVEPREEDYPNNYGDYVRAVAKWQAVQIIQERDAHERARRAAEVQQQQRQGWQDRVSVYRQQERPDFDDVMQEVAHVLIPPDVQQVLMDSEQGPALAYALAQDPAELERIVNLPPLAAARALGRIEAKLTGASEKPKAVPVSRAPEPIRPVGQGAASRPPKPLDELPYQEYKRRREQEIAARHKRTV